MFPVTTVLWPLTLCSHDVKGGYMSHVLRRDDRDHHGHLSCCQWALSVPPPPPLPGTSTAVLSSQNRLRELSPKVPQRPSQGLELGCGEKVVRLPVGERERRATYWETKRGGRGAPPSTWVGANAVTWPQEETALRMGTRAWGESTQVHSGRGQALIVPGVVLR